MLCCCCHVQRTLLNKVPNEYTVDSRLLSYLENNTVFMPVRKKILKILSHIKVGRGAEKVGGRCSKDSRLSLFSDCGRTEASIQPVGPDSLISKTSGDALQRRLQTLSKSDRVKTSQHCLELKDTKGRSRELHVLLANCVNWSRRRKSSWCCEVIPLKQNDNKSDTNKQTARMISCAAAFQTVSANR